MAGMISTKVIGKTILVIIKWETNITEIIVSLIKETELEIIRIIMLINTDRFK